MQRRKGRCGVQLLHDLYVDQAMLPQLRSAMNGTMADCDGGRGAAVVKEFADAGNRFPLRGNGRRLGQPRMAAQILRVKLATFLADRLGLAGQQQLRFLRADAIQAELERGRTAVQCQHDQLGGDRCRTHAQAAQRQSRTSGRSSPCSLM